MVALRTGGYRAPGIKAAYTLEYARLWHGFRSCINVTTNGEDRFMVTFDLFVRLEHFCT